ncbi:MAG: hypothetical protein RBU23_00385 [Candidatus Auribacterota bacterium]|nr:hypothetical protein [Candidatus Auribacterota bacterium]
MKIVAKCPFCGKKIRFPINKGKLLIRCPKCLNQFVFDPSIKRMTSMLSARLKTLFSGWASTARKYLRKK